MGSKGGGTDTSAMLQYGDKALQLQKDQYDYSKQVSQPWLNTGTSAINQLSTLMGLSGGGNQSRQSFYDKLAPQYTTTTQVASPNTGYMVGSNGKMINIGNENDVKQYMYDTRGEDAFKWGADYNMIKNNPSNFGLTPFQTAQSQTSTDTNGLNAAVDAAYNNQATDAGYGDLLKTYTGQDIYTDPSYKFRVDQGNKAMERQLAASGKYLTPAASQALMELGQNMGSQEYQNAYNRFNTDQGNLYNRLAGLAGMGQTQSGQVIGAGQNYANAGSDIYTGMGNAITAAQQVDNSKPSMFSTLGGTVFTGKTPWGNLW